MRWLFTIIFIAINPIFTGENGQFSPPNATQSSPAHTATATRPSAKACATSKDVMPKDLYGEWVLELKTPDAAGGILSTRLSFKQNPEFAESLAGRFSLQGREMEVFGDLEDGALELEESDNGKDIRALWKGKLAEGSCGQAITGTRRLVATQAEQSFVLRRAGW